MYNLKRILWELLAGTKGGKNRARIIYGLKNRPYNANQLAEKLSLNYKTIKYHIEVLENNGVVVSAGNGYGALYFLSEKMEENFDTFKQICDEFKESNNNLYYVEDNMSEKSTLEIVH